MTGFQHLCTKMGAERHCHQVKEIGGIGICGSRALAAIGQAGNMAPRTQSPRGAAPTLGLTQWQCRGAWERDNYPMNSNAFPSGSRQNKAFRPDLLTL